MKKTDREKEEAKQAGLVMGLLLSGLALLGYFVGFFVKAGEHLAAIFMDDHK